VQKCRLRKNNDRERGEGRVREIDESILYSVENFELRFCKGRIYETTKA
jgi:hypothetical protein